MNPVLSLKNRVVVREMSMIRDQCDRRKTWNLYGLRKDKILKSESCLRFEMTLETTSSVPRGTEMLE